MKLAKLALENRFHVLPDRPLRDVATTGDSRPLQLDDAVGDPLDMAELVGRLLNASASW